MNPRGVTKWRWPLLVAAAIGLFPALAAAANGFTQPYLMALDVCKQNGIQGCTLPGQGAGAETVYLLQSADGVAWTKVPGFTPYEGAVPAILRRGTTVYLVSMTLGPPPAYELRRYRMDSGAWEGPFPISISDPQYPGSPNSPALILDAQGRIALLLDTDGQCKRSTCDTVHQRITTEVGGSDGTQFVAQPDDLVATPLFEQSAAGIGAVDATITFDGTRYIVSLPTTRRINPIMGSRLFTSANVYGPYAASTAFPNGVIATSGVTTFYNAARQQYWHYSWLPAPSLYRSTAASLDIALDTGDFVPANAVVTSTSLNGDGTQNIEHPHFAANWSGTPTISATSSPRSLQATTGMAASATVTLNNSDVVAAGDCFVAPITTYPGGFSYQATTPTSAAANTPVLVAAGATQTFTISFTTTEPFAAREISLRIGCASSTSAPVASGVNTIAVTSTGSPIRNYQGMWWNSPPGSEGGWGVNITHQGDTLFATWFTYDTDGSPLWFVMSNGQTTGDATYTGQLHRATGPPYNLLPYDNSKFVLTLVGSATFTFSDAGNGTFAYTVNGLTQRKPITRYIFATPVPACAAGTAGSTTPNYTDMWWNSPPGSEGGWGVNITHQGDTLFATWFTYDTSGKPLWFVMSSGTKAGDRMYSGQIHRATGAPFGATPWNPALFTLTLVGTGTFNFANANNGLFSYTVNGQSQAKAITRYVFSTPTLCQ
jgi:hypothetical protein